MCIHCDPACISRFQDRIEALEAQLTDERAVAETWRQKAVEALQERDHWREVAQTEHQARTEAEQDHDNARQRVPASEMTRHTLADRVRALEANERDLKEENKRLGWEITRRDNVLRQLVRKPSDDPYDPAGLSECEGHYECPFCHDGEYSTANIHHKLGCPILTGRAIYAAPAEEQPWVVQGGYQHGQ